MGYKKSEYKFIKFEKSNAKGKKYTAYIKNKKNDKIFKIHFGSDKHFHFKDSTGLGAWSKNDHMDLERRRRYRARHAVYLNKDEYSPAYFSWKFLW